MGIHDILVMQAEEKGLEKGLEKGKIETIINLYKKGQPIDFISEIVNMPYEKVEKIIKQHFS
jgi:hypothetical protein